MPERPAVSASQLASLPWPSEVTMPKPVTATIGRPWLSRWLALMGASLCLDQPGRAFAAPMGGAGDDRFFGGAGRERGGGKRDRDRESGLDIMADKVAGGDA